MNQNLGFSNMVITNPTNVDDMSTYGRSGNLLEDIEDIERESMVESKKPSWLLVAIVAYVAYKQM